MSITKPPEAKYNRMKQVVSSIECFLESKSDEAANAIIAHLQALSLTIDLSIFDPNTNITIQFYMSLYNLMNRMEQKSPFAWHCVDVLSNACKNPAARQTLIENYQFIPSLGRLLSVQLILEKKTRLLRLMQDLSCGIKMSWQIPYLSHLMRILAQLAEAGHEEIVALSLGVLVNLCYKNLPAIYTLMGNVDVKKLLRVCSPMQGSVEIHTCKLLIILDCVNGQVPKATLSKLMHVTFKSIVDSYRQKDSLVMRQVVEFFLDVIKQHDNSLKMIIDEDYSDNELKELISVIEDNEAMDIDEDTSTLDFRHPECVAYMFQFFCALVESRLLRINKTYPVLIQAALKYIETELVSPHALALLTVISKDIDDFELKILEPLAKYIPVFLTILKNRNEHGDTQQIEQKKRIAGLLNLLNSMVQIPNIRPKLLEDLQTETVGQLFMPLMEDDDNFDEMDVVSIQAIALVASLANHDVHWMALQDRLLQHKPVLEMLANTLYFGSEDIKQLALKAVQVSNFPVDSFAKVLTRIDQRRIPNDTKKTSSPAFQDLSFPVLSVAQIHQLDNVLDKFRNAASQNPYPNTSTSEVMELYEYKLAAIGHENRAAMASVEAATERCTYLQHRISQLSTEINKFHQLLYKAEQCQEQTLKVKETLCRDLRELTNKSEADKGKIKACKSQLSMKEDELKNCKASLEETTKRLNEATETNEIKLEEIKKLNSLINKLKENSLRLEKLLQKKEDLLKKAGGDIESLNLELKDLQTTLKSKEAEIHTKNMELNATHKELLAKKQLIDSISKMANNNSQF